MRNKSAQFSIAIVCLVLGIMIAVQFKTTEANSDVNLAPARVADLTLKLMTTTEERDALAEEVFALRERLNNIRMDNEAMADLQQELQKSNMAAGFLPLSGPGVHVILNDSIRNLEKGEDPNLLLVHDEDILRIVNELKASGAEAIAVNEERLTAMSEIRCAGTTILVNWNRIAPPFIIKAIGDPEMLESGLLIRGGHVESLKIYGIEVQIKKAETIEIPAYNGPLKFVYAKPVQSKAKVE